MRSPLSAPLILAVSVAITRGAVLMTPSWSVGPYREATDPAGSQRYVCLDLQGTPQRAFEVGEEPYLVRGAVFYEDKYSSDWSAFGAAKIFVALAGPKAVKAALAKLKEVPPCV